MGFYFLGKTSAHHFKVSQEKMPLEKENLTGIAVKQSKEKSPLESLEKLIINLFNTRTYRSPVPAKERHLQAEGWGSVLTTIQSCRMTSLCIVCGVIVVCNMTAADSLCQAFPGGNKHPGFLLHQGRTEWKTKAPSSSLLHKQTFSPRLFAKLRAHRAPREGCRVECFQQDYKLPAVL